MKTLIEKLKALRLYFISCRFSHKWEYFDNELTRKCERCGTVDVTVGEEPSMYRMGGDKWVRTYNGNGN